MEPNPPVGVEPESLLMAENEINRNLLPGILALREGLIDAPTLLAAFDVWCDDPTRSLVQLLWESRDLADGDRDRLLATAAGHAPLRTHDHRPSPAPVETHTGLAREPQGAG